jgi:ZIP family zinc transporter
MLEALLWGLLSASSLLLGGVVALRVSVGRRPLGLIMAFGSGVLISAVAFELVQEALRISRFEAGVAGGLAAGALTFFAGDWLLDRHGAHDRKRSGGPQASGVGLPIVLGIVLDGIPESAVVGLTVLQNGTVGAAVLVAVFLSNLPEAIAATSGLARARWRPSRILGLWLLVMAISALAALAGYVLLDGASDKVVAFVLSFAGGAILTMLADTMMPEAFAEGGRAVGLVTTLGFGLAFFVSALA